MWVPMKMITATIASYFINRRRNHRVTQRKQVSPIAYFQAYTFASSCLVTSACPYISLSVCNCPLYCMAVGLHAYQCVSRRLGETAHTALDKAQSPDSRPIPYIAYTQDDFGLHLSVCTMLVYMSALCLLLMHTRSRGERATGRKRSR